MWKSVDGVASMVILGFNSNNGILQGESPNPQEQTMPEIQQLSADGDLLLKFSGLP